MNRFKTKQEASVFVWPGQAFYAFLSPVTDKDRPTTWIKYKNGMCDGCIAACCTMPVEVRFDDLLRLKKVSEDDRFASRKKVFRRLHSEGIAMSFREGTDLFMLQSRPNGDCPFLNEKTRLCTDYENRPDVCRSFPAIGPRPGFCPRKSKL